ncbi:efflux RND transporter periplasmic adaptor subunit [Acinetobacter sp. MD2(2019)]|uniref:efflux RND transporter periplasmic adaptor subunit n=1 Tax=Acinetobacter sp. MD2(2019) TaxID=2605273 RepID=UPI002D1ED85D|nr:efflux RND transporter periplasmic adaptor subunit [Acinetobacter sp. MD2(2019)]MEB3753914.1 efflux RND transporter periplasmic adaptor subunit [Acinetobacter sp. MD2(2019)]
MMSAKLWAPALTACALATSIALVGCGNNKKESEQAAAAAQQAPMAQVGVIVAQAQNVEKTVELAGRTSPYEVSEVRPQTGGVILKRLFAEGSYVKAGQALYQLDQRTNSAAVENANAAVLQQSANLASLRTKANRYQQLIGINAVSKQDYDDLLGQIRVAQAQVEAAKAEVKNARINLDYSTIRAPISGQTNRSTVTTGALVTANQSNALVTIQRLDPIYVDINQSSSDLLRLRQELKKGSLGNSNNAKVKLKLEDGSTYPIEGTLAFSDASVDSNTGSVTIRAIFQNPDHLLLPGMYTSAQIVEGVLQNVYRIPQVAVTRTPTGQATLFVVNQKGIIEVRNVETSGTQGTDWIISKGLNAGDKVVIDGVAKVKEGQQVKTVPYQAQPSAAAPAKPAATQTQTSSTESKAKSNA